ncbi:formate/nitrite transporter family protein [Pedosphaera parvula]|uniref:Formate/nitrite transporter n=1 Tax=Pedosphaera parvula (strain Ellin514) TaxID=320771 RepID=B9XH45_PEDPL|nr:formate/nitrite transporter family protein [Pedosphaera parvula]EEF60966.1 formate/nitrite transporter [Pedosphaera parvula Ellin514]
MKERSSAKGNLDRRQEQEANPAEKEQLREEEEVQHRTAIGAHVVYEAILKEGEQELSRPASALAFSGLAAGLSMGFSFLTQGFLEAHLPATKWAPLVAKLGYSVGFLIVILGRQQLFTENTLTPVLPFLRHPNIRTLSQIARLWIAVFLANWVGTMLFAWVLGHSSIIEDSSRDTFLKIGRQAMGDSFGGTMLKAVFAGWLIALLVWLLPYAETGRVTVIIIMTYVIALGSFSHIIAGSVDTFYLVALHDRTFGQYLIQFMLPTLIGNIIGGIALVTALNHAQVVAGTDHD